MSPASVRERLMHEAIVAGRARDWLAGCAFVAVSWRRGNDGEMYATGPTPDEIEQLRAQAGEIDPKVREAALALLRSIVDG